MANEQHGSSWAGGPASMAEWADAMVRLPFQMFTTGMSMVDRMVGGMPGMPGMTAPAAPKQYGWPEQPASSPDRPHRPAASSPPAPAAPRSEQRSESNPTPLGAPARVAREEAKETVMGDHNLNDDLVKMVSYSIACIQRGNERVMACNRCKVFSDNMDACAFETWIISEYIQEWHALHPDARCFPCDSKFLRVSYEVQGRWPKQDLHYEEKELDRLAGIERAILSCCGKEDEAVPCKGEEIVHREPRDLEH